MPQASDELRETIRSLFVELHPGRHDHEPIITDGDVTEYLRTQGWDVDRRWNIIPPYDIRQWNDVSMEIMDCINYLQDEWDYGGVRWERL